MEVNKEEIFSGFAALYSDGRILKELEQYILDNIDRSFTGQELIRAINGLREAGQARFKLLNSVLEVDPNGPKSE